MKYIVHGIYLGIIVGMLLSFGGVITSYVRLDNGLECAVVNFFPDCNWEGYNYKTYYGTAPLAQPDYGEEE